MESSEILGGMEECHSCESGWTTYIGSPVQGDDDDDEDDGGHGEADGDGGEIGSHADANHEVDSDDSMASDASSGPSHQGQLGQGHGSTSTSYFKQDEDHRHYENKRDCYLDKKAAKKSTENHQKLGLMKKKEDKQVKVQQMTLKAERNYHRSFSM